MKLDFSTLQANHSKIYQIGTSKINIIYHYTFAKQNHWFSTTKIIFVLKQSQNADEYKDCVILYDTKQVHLDKEDTESKVIPSSSFQHSIELGNIKYIFCGNKMLRISHRIENQLKKLQVIFARDDLALEWHDKIHQSIKKAKSANIQKQYHVIKIKQLQEQNKQMKSQLQNWKKSSQSYQHKQTYNMQNFLDLKQKLKQSLKQNDKLKLLNKQYQNNLQQSLSASNISAQENEKESYFKLKKQQIVLRAQIEMNKLDYKEKQDKIKKQMKRLSKQNEQKDEYIKKLQKQLEQLSKKLNNLTISHSHEQSILQLSGNKIIPRTELEQDS